MLSLRFVRKTGWTLSFLCMAGCAQLGLEHKESIPDRTPVVNEQSDLDELLDFGTHIAGLPPALRTEECRSLVKRHKEAPDTQLKLRLLVGRLLSDACGDIPKILDMIASIPPGSLTEPPLQKLVTIDTEVLKGLLNQSKKLGSAERKQKKVQTMLESKDTAGSKKDENQLLREKLEAIRTMEKQLDESGEGK